MNDITIVTVTAVGVMTLITLSAVWIIRGLQRTIGQQNDTIQRLIQHDSVTYAETGQKPAKPNRERYAAWGSQMVDIDEDGQHS